MKMSVTINNQHGNVDIATEVIATVVGASTTEIFGVVGMTSFGESAPAEQLFKEFQPQAFAAASTAA